MTDEIKTTNILTNKTNAVPANGPSGNFSDQKGGRKNFSRGRGKNERTVSEFDQKILDIRRVTRVVAGGRRFSFAVAIAIGDKKGSVGVGTGKSGDTSMAINKAVKSAKKRMLKLRLTKSMSIPFDSKAKFSSSRIVLMPNHGKGLVAGSSARHILYLAGVKDVSAKILSGSKNKLNNAKATMDALSAFRMK